jgi:tRNA (guanine-N7-)-methyltransferase
MTSPYRLHEETILPASQRPQLAITPSDSSSSPQWAFDQMFGNPNPVYLEIGFGKGLFLMKSGHQFPHLNFLGIEYARKYYRLALDRIAKRGIDNVRLYCGEALEALQNLIPDESLNGAFLFFPDPWPKKRHHKRRFVQESTVGLIHRKLKPGGEWIVVTDHEDYWQWIDGIMNRQSLLIPQKESQWPLPLGELTNYDIKFVQEGRQTFCGTYRKETSSS